MLELKPTLSIRPATEPLNWVFAYVIICAFKGILTPLFFLIKGLQYLQSLNFERIVLSQLNPLKICLPQVVNFFAAITK